MSLPKEPRQLMITLMYLVLTAMLALNVSAEILNAFMTMDESINESNKIVGKSNDQLYDAILEQSNAYPQYKTHEATAGRAMRFTSIFCAYVEELKQQLIKESGGLNEFEQPIGIKDKDTPTRLFVEEGLGEFLKDSILSTRENLLTLIEDPVEKESVSQAIPLRINELPKSTEANSWSEFTFRQMPVAAVLPMLSKFQADAKLAETSLLTFLANKISAKPVHNEYKALISADKSYVIKGEDINAEIFLGAYSSTTDNIRVKVNGSYVPVRNGKAIFNQSTSSIGNKTLDVEIFAKDPLSGIVKTYQKKFNYEVGERSVTTSADKMNVFYVGVENPFSVSAAGVTSESVQVSGNGLPITKVRNGKYIVKPTRIGDAKITVTGGGLPNTNFEYRVKRIPTPIAKLGNKMSGSMSANEFKLYKKLDAHLENFDFDAECRIISYEMIRVNKHNEGFPSQNNGNKFNSKSLRLSQAAKRGDKFYFESIKAKCPGDQYSRKINSLFFKIK